MTEMLVQRIARIQRHKCKTFAHKPESKEPVEKFLIFKQSSKKGKSPLTVGFIICLIDAHSSVWINFGDGKKGQSNAKGHIRIFNHTYHRNREFKGCITVRDSNPDWKVHTFSVTPDKDYSQRGGLITKFYQTKGAGITQGAGTDVAFMISTGRTLKKTTWNFDTRKPPHRQLQLELSTNHAYKKAGRYQGSITVEDYEGKTKTHVFRVIVEKNPRNSCCKKFIAKTL